MTYGNDLREDGWQEPKMRKRNSRDVVDATTASQPGLGPRRQRPGRKCDYLRVGFSLKITGILELQASPPTLRLSKSGLFYNCTWISVIFGRQASIRY